MKKAFIQLHIAIFLAGFTGILGKLITLNEGLLVWYRLLITSITLWIIFLFSQKIQRPSLPDILKIFGVGIITTLHWVSFYGSIKYSNVSVALVCFSSIGFFTALFEPVILKKRINKLELLLGLIAIAGIYLIFHFDPQYKTGIVIGVVSALLGSLFPIFNGIFLKRIPPQTVVLYELSGGLLFLTILLPLYLQWFPAITLIPTLNDFGWLLVLSWFCTVLAFTLSMNALKKISAFTVNLSFNLEPLYGILLAFIIYNEHKSLTESFYIGFFLIVFSVMLQSYFIYKAHKK